MQFLLIALLPLSFIAMIVYVWRARLKRRRLYLRWTLTLLLAAVWASSVLRFFGGVAFPEILIFNWGVVGTYALNFTAVTLLLTTLTYFNLPKGHGRVALVLSLLLIAAAIALDPTIWGQYLPLFTTGGQYIFQSGLWTAVWIAAWLIPIIAAWILTQQVKVNLPLSIYRNQVNYWLLVITLFVVGFGFASIQQRGQSGWQQSGILLIILAALIGTLTLTRPHLPELQLASRQALSRLAGTLIIFGLTWLALSVIVQTVSNLPAATAVSTQTLILTIAAALFAAFFTLVYRWVNEFTRRIFLRGQQKREVALAEFSNIAGNMPEPAQLGQIFLRLVQSNLTTDDAWLFKADDGPGGRLVLRPLASLDKLPYTPADFNPDSPFSQHLRQNNTPLIHSDLDTIEQYADIPEAERDLLTRWQRVLYQPLHAGDTLIGVLALGPKYTGEGYSQEELALLDGWAAQISPLLAQAHNLASLRQINDYVFRQNQTLAREKQHLQELVNLYADFMEMISPDLRRPFTDLNREMQKYQTKAGEKEAQIVGEIVTEVSQQIAALRTPIDNLITISARIQMRSQFKFEPVHLDHIAQEAIRHLHSMAEARRVKIDFHANPSHATALGDAPQLLEATQHLLHNAIKFNKIGGMVMVECGSEGSDAFLRILDNGVGIPEERLGTLWEGFNTAGKNGNGRRAGMGLALAQFIIKAHGGHITAESKYGNGSTFTIYLPLVYEE
ncbi:MAG TPA: GAF domain-containing sensor histidine kinase [Chloroflexota bacterium]|nr:GAF domain-containing sensor histidine kinase [Chloroflexota bacterium]